MSDKGKDRLAIWGAGALIAASILIVFRWQVTIFPGGGVLRLDHWTGWTTVCSADQDYEGRTTWKDVETGKPCPF